MICSFLAVGFIKLATAATDDSIDFASFVSAVDLPYPMSDMTAVTVPESYFTTNDGPRIYLMGGCVSDQTCVYSNTTTKEIFCFCTKLTDKVIYFTPQTNLYHEVASMPFPRYRHVAAREGNYIYVAGGRNISDTIIKDVYRYDVVANSWEFVVTWENATSDGVAFTSTQDQNLYLVSGYNQNYGIVGNMDVLNTNSGNFLPFGSFPSMNVPRGDSQVASLFDTQYYVIGGWSTVDDDSFCRPSHVVEYYDVTTKKWTTTDQLHYGRGDLASGVLNNMIFAVGGEQKDSSDATCTYSVPVKDVERYLFSNASWVIEESIPSNIFRFVGATYNSSNSLYDSAIYLFGGQGTYDADAMSFPVRNSTLVYYPQAIYGSKHRKELDAAGIAGIVVAGVVVLACVVFGIISGLVYRYTYYRYKPLEEADSGADSNISGESRFPSPVISSVSKVTNSTRDGGGVGINMMAVSHRHGAASDHDLEIMEMQDSFPEHVGPKSVQERTVAKVLQGQEKF